MKQMSEEIKEPLEDEEPQEAAEETAEQTQEEIGEEEKLKAKVEELENKYLRLYAEFDNFKKRSAREKDARYGDAVIDTVATLLEVADNLERALKVEVTSEDAKAFYAGVEMVDKQMKEAFSKIGVKQIPALGEQFDPNLHNAVMHVEDDGVDDNTVVEEFMKGYIYNDSRVVRHSMVKVAN